MLLIVWSCLCFFVAALSQSVKAFQYVNATTNWTMYDPAYSVQSIGLSYSVQLSPQGRSYVSAIILYEGEVFYPENNTDKFIDTVAWYAHVHSDPCNDNRGNHWKANTSIMTPVESNEVWFLHSNANAPMFARNVSQQSHPLPAAYDPTFRSLTIHEPKINGTAAKIACMDLIYIASSSNSSSNSTTSPEEFTSETGALVMFIWLGAFVLFYAVR